MNKRLKVMYNPYVYTQFMRKENNQTLALPHIYGIIATTKGVIAVSTGV